MVIKIKLLQREKSFRWKYHLLICSFIKLVFIFSSCSGAPLNLAIAKIDVMEYYESGEFDKELKCIIEDALNYFKDREINNNSVVIFDVDETALSNYKINKELDFGYVPEIWDEWIQEAMAPAIPHVKNLYDFLVEKNIRIIFLTGRKYYQSASTSINLKREGYTFFDTLITRNENEYKLTALEYKSKKRIELTKNGYNIIGTIGDQWSDLKGEYHGYQLKIPNYIYLIE